MTLIFKWKFASPHEAPNLIILIQQPTFDQIQLKFKNKNNTWAVFLKHFFLASDWISLSLGNKFSQFRERKE